ncbi:hypothetical protein SPONL_849 [uncultured Candidatus Thioglobus sp.]|nr:hypothetical protein SPONL_849 [uncultured Candidatus Thioglobus sp.]
METITIEKQEWQTIPNQAQKEVYDFFLFVKEKYKTEVNSTMTAMASEKSLAKNWLDAKEDKAWAHLKRQI